MKKSLYAALGVESNASDNAIREAFDALMAKLDANDSMGRVAAKEAFSVLGHAQRRAAYDASLLEAARRERHREEQRGKQAALAAEPASSRKWLWIAGAVALVAGGWWMHARKPAAHVVSKQMVETVEMMPGATPAAADAAANADAGKVLSPEELFAKVSASVVRVNVSDAAGNDLKLGSGVVIDRGTVITNCHVVKGGAKVKVKYLNDQLDASVALADEQHDLCKLSVFGLSAPSIKVGKVANVHVGQKVYAIGSPQGLDLTISDGMVSSLRESQEGTFIQTTAPISPGSSGGGLFTETGVLVGIVTFQMRSGQNLNFAIPADWIATMSASTAGEAERDDGPSGKPISRAAADILGTWHCFGPLTGRGMDLTFENNNNFSGSFDGKPLGGTYYLSGKQLNLAGDYFQLEDLNASHMVISQGDGRRLACTR